MGKPRVWTCQRRSGGQRCGHVNPRRKHLCERCGKRRPPTPQPAHRKILAEMSYEQCVERYGERCGICGVEPKPGKKLHRDHDHRTGKMRGLLCFRCNIMLPDRGDLAWLRKAAAYLERAA